MRALRLTLALLLTHTAAALVMIPGASRSLREVAHNELPFLLALCGIAPLFGAIVFYRLRVGGAANVGWRRGIAVAMRRGWLGDRLFTFVLVVVLLPVFFWAFAAWKTHIPPFTWDATFSFWDRWLHGDDPYRRLIYWQRPSLTKFLERCYYLWRFVLLGLIVWQCWAGSIRSRARFWLAFVLTWIILGNVLSGLTPSAGPLYYRDLTGNFGPYADMMTYLSSMREGVLTNFFTVQRNILNAVMQKQILLGAGVAAFPSLHVAVPILGACAAWRTSRLLTSGFLAFALVIWIGSIHLGWHYAIDGEASALLVPAVWWLSGRIAGRRDVVIADLRAAVPIRQVAA